MIIIFINYYYYYDALDGSIKYTAAIFLKNKVNKCITTVTQCNHTHIQC